MGVLVEVGSIQSSSMGNEESGMENAASITLRPKPGVRCWAREQEQAEYETCTASCDVTVQTGHVKADSAEPASFCRAAAILRWRLSAEATCCLRGTFSELRFQWARQAD